MGRKGPTAAPVDLQGALEKAPLLLGVIEIVPGMEDDFLHLYANHAFERWYGASMTAGRWAARDLGMRAALAAAIVEQCRLARSAGTAQRLMLPSLMAGGDQTSREISIAFLEDRDEGSERYCLSAALTESSGNLSTQLNERQQGFRQLAESTNDIFWLVNAVSGGLLYVSPALARITGRSAEELTDEEWPLASIVHPDDVQSVTGQFALWRKRLDAPLHLEYRLLHKDGSVIWIADDGYVLRNASGEARRLFGIARNITDRKNAEDALIANEERLRLAAAAARFGSYDYHLQTDEIYWSPELAALHGRPEQRVLSGRDAFDAVHPDDRAKFRAIWARIRLDPAAADRHELEYRIVRPDGQVRCVRDCGQAVRPKGEASRVVGFVQDITEQREAERALVEADQRKDEFLAMLGHELRNPLTPVRSGLELLKQAADNPEVIARTREIMSRQVDHLVRLVDDLLDVSRITRGKLTLKKDRVALTPILKTAICSCEAVIVAKGHHFEKSLPTEEIWLDVDAARITQVVVNLLSNAAKFTPDGGRINLSATGEDSVVRISVSDSGVGIPKDRQDEIFNLFGQIEGGYQQDGGLGIGLTLVRSLISMHDGRVEVTSDGKGHGSTFSIWLPVCEAGSRSTSAPELPVEAVSRRVLVADDNLAACEILASVIEQAGNEVRTATDGRQALEIARTFEPHVVLLDIAMPVMDGYETSRALRQLPFGEQLTIVAVTGWTQEKDRMRARNAGFDLHLAKPPDTRQLLEVIRQCRAANADEIDVR